MDRWYKLGQAAAKSAFKYRLQRSIGLESPFDVYETIHQEKLELQFVDIPSLEGMCLQEPEVTRICVTAERPWGRQRFTAAHELAHFLFRHGSQVDTVMESREDIKTLSDEEVLADAFARFVLMPPRAVGKALAGARTIDAGVVFKASCWLGVGYESLVMQLCRTLKVINKDKEVTLMRPGRQRIAQMIVGDSTFKADVWPLDQNWRDKTVHVQLGDAVLGVTSREDGVLAPCSEGALVKAVGETAANLIAGGQVTIRASKRNYVGFYEYRYLPE